MNTIDDIQTLLDSMRSRRGEMAKFEGLLDRISTALAEIVGLMERADAREAAEPPEPPETDMASTIAECMRMLPAPIVNVTIPPLPAPTIIMPPADAQPQFNGWRLRVLQYDGNGKASDISFTPLEK